MKELDEYKTKGDILMLEPERKANDIKNSVLWTGKIPEIKENQVEEEIPEEPKKIETEEPQPQEVPVEEVKKEEINVEMPKVEYKVPTNPIMNNPNIIRSAPINPYSIPTNNFGNPNPLNNYYNTYINPYVFQNQNFGFSPQQHRPPVNYNIGILPNNFQGKIPMSYGNPFVNQYVSSLQGPQLIGMNMNINRPSMMGIPNMPAMPTNMTIRPPMAKPTPKPEKNEADDIHIENVNK
jgi:hypothetical protein